MKKNKSVVEIVAHMMEMSMKLKERDEYVVPVCFLFREDQTFEISAFPEVTMEQKELLTRIIKKLTMEKPTKMVMFLSDSSYREIEKDEVKEKKGALVAITLAKGEAQGRSFLIPYEKGKCGKIFWGVLKEIKTSINNVIEPWGLTAA